MSDERMYDLTIRALVDGGFELEQTAGSLEEPALITLHPMQVRWLAERAGLLGTDPTPRLTARHIGRLRALRDKIDQVYRFYHDEILDRCGSGIEISLHIEAISDLTDELLADIDDSNAASVTPALSEAVTECHDKSAVISVTPKRGRPAKPDALTPAERQRAHRAKQAEAPHQTALSLTAEATT